MFKINISERVIKATAVPAAVLAKEQGALYYGGWGLA